MKKLMIVFLTAVLTVTSGYAQMRGEGHGPDQSSGGRGREFGGEMKGPRMGEKGPGGMIERLLDNPELMEKAGISKEQLTAIKNAMDEIEIKMIDLRAEMEKAGIAQAQLMSQEKIDEDAIMKAVEKTGEIRTKMAKLHIQSMLTIKKSITPEQMAKIKELLSQRRKEMSEEDRAAMREKMKERFGRGEPRKRMHDPEEGEAAPPPPEM